MATHRRYIRCCLTYIGQDQCLGPSSNKSPVMPTDSASSAVLHRSWTTPPRLRTSPPTCAEYCAYGIGTANSRAATGPGTGVIPTTLFPGIMMDRRRLRTSPCCAHSITRSNINKAGSSAETQSPVKPGSQVPSPRGRLDLGRTSKEIEIVAILRVSRCSAGRASHADH